MIPRACVIGWPIGHSRSPLIHGYWLRRYGLAGDYGKRAVAPDELDAFLGDLEGHGFVGCNVTLPHKEAAFRAVAVRDEATRRLKVVNTVFLREGRAFGLSSDGEGFLASLRQALGTWSGRGRRVVMLGAGGAARALAGALADEAVAELVVVNRDIARAGSLRRDFGGFVIPQAWARAGEVIAEADLLINATSLGMAGQPPLDLDLARLGRHTVVSDLVYSPLATPLIEEARARGNPVVPGLGMLLHQAVRGFELWFGVRPEVTPELHDLVAADIGRRP